MTSIDTLLEQFNRAQREQARRYIELVRAGSPRGVELGGRALRPQDLASPDLDRLIGERFAEARPLP